MPRLRSSTTPAREAVQQVRSPALLLVESHLRESGGLRVAHEVARRLPGSGVAVTLFVLQQVDGDAAVLQLDPAVDVEFAARRPLRLRTALPLAMLRLVPAARRVGLVLSGSEVGYGLLLGWLGARLARRPFAVLVQSNVPRAMADWVPGPLHPVTRWVYRHLDLAVCVSPGLVPDVLAMGVGSEQVAVVPVGVSVEDTIQAAAGTTPDPDAPYVMAMGRLDHQKGFDVLIRAFAAAHGRMPGWRLVLVGEGPLREALADLAGSLGIGSLVEMPGFVANPHPRLAGASLYVLSSRYEGMGGLALLEAMAHGLPIIATDCVSGPRELLEDGRLGALVPVEDVASLATALVAHAQDPAPLKAAADRAPDRARQLGPDRWVGALATVLRPLATGHEQGAA